MEADYWNSVADRLKSLGKAALNLAVPAAVDFAVNAAVEKSCSVIEEKLRKLYKKTGINTAISFSINLAGVLLLVLKPFGENISRYVAVAFFFASFVFWLVRTVLFINDYGKTTLEVSKAIIKEKSVYKGIEEYVLNSFPLISLCYAGVSLASEYVPALKDVPGISDFVKHLVKIFWKRVALFAGVMAVYTVMIFWIVKPILISRYF